ncbi:N,N-dimethylformamidase beta subunit family domain-containing protein [Streptomyces sp. NBC_01089]|uniref:N,N-dimethylformamidase beta subunit family domain-containing protein n=1 Tax=Streptomyces sp. NBC_01089 TaxID=2903747 RepID=UPI00386F00A3|nr:hypothetical protein OG510_00550 [Streptomyces sp. NBC_01089]WSU46332.1 hypothetical protein OG510_36600 [Streptomyces sp. NBC_01089]
MGEDTERHDRRAGHPADSAGARPDTDGAGTRPDTDSAGAGPDADGTGAGPGRRRFLGAAAALGAGGLTASLVAGCGTSPGGSTATAPRPTATATAPRPTASSSAAALESAAGAERARPGSPDWRIRSQGPPEAVQGYTDKVSVLPGEEFGLHVSTTAPGFRVSAYRVTPGAPTPAPLEILAHSPLVCDGRDSHADSAYYTVPSGAGVFSCGTMRWVEALMAATRDGGRHHGMDARTRAFVTRTTENLLRAFATGPAATTRPAPKDNVRSVYAN